ncbi:MAG: hypothetical protein M0R21_02405 [Lentimicrobiaceae bacterium]|nr:hypothetical protein [Lentimicrobiaceae bacterium]
MKTCFALFIYTFGLHFPITAMAQNEEITVVAPFDPTVPEATKINGTPSIYQSTLQAPTVVYSIRTSQYPTNFQVEPVKPLNVAGESLPDVTKGYVKAGIGNYWTPYLEAFYSSTRNEKQSWNIHYKHHSVNGSIKDYDNSTYSTNSLSLNGKHFFENQTQLSANLGFSRDVHHFYGYKPSDYTYSLSKNDIKQRFSTFNGTLLYQSNNPELEKGNYFADLHFFSFSDRWESHELNIGTNAGVYKNYDAFRFADKEIVGINLNADFYDNEDSLLSKQNSIIRIQPYIRGVMQGFNILIGLQPVIVSGSESKFYLYPKAEASINLLEDLLMLRAGIDGNLQQNGLRSLTQENPYLNNTSVRKNSNEKFRIFAGINSNPSAEISLRAVISSSRILDYPFYINDINSYNKDTNSYAQAFHNKFSVEYDDITLFSFTGEASYHVNSWISATVKGGYYHYSMDKLEKPFHRPDWDLVMQMQFKTSKRLSFNSQLFTAGKRYVKDYTNETRIDPVTQTSSLYVYEKIKQLDPVFDMNIGAQYSVTEKISAFLQLNNLTSSSYSLWNNYPVKGFNVLLGASYNF